MRAAGSTDTRTGGGCGPRDVANAWSARHQLVRSFGVPNLLGASRQYRAIGAHRLVARHSPRFMAGAEYGRSGLAPIEPRAKRHRNLFAGLFVLRLS